MIDKLTIHIVSDRKDFSWEKAQHEETRIVGFANSRKEIGILGKKIGTKIVVNQMVLGHELKHVLNWIDPQIVDPHDKGTMEYCIGKGYEKACRVE